MECDETREYCTLLRDKYNAMVYPLVANMRAPPGWPDRYIHHAYWAGHIEFKSPTGKVDKKQEIIIRELCTRRPGSAFFGRFDVSGVSIQLTWWSSGRNNWFELFVPMEPIAFLRTLENIQQEEMHYARCAKTTCEPLASIG